MSSDDWPSATGRLDRIAGSGLKDRFDRCDLTPTEADEVACWRSGPGGRQQVGELIEKAIDHETFFAVHHIPGTPAVVACNESPPSEYRLFGLDDQFYTLHPVGDERKQALVE